MVTTQHRVRATRGGRRCCSSRNTIVTLALFVLLTAALAVQRVSLRRQQRPLASVTRIDVATRPLQRTLASRTVLPRASEDATLLVERAYYLPPEPRSAATTIIDAPFTSDSDATGFAPPPAVVISLFNELHVGVSASARYALTLTAERWKSLSQSLRSPAGRHFRCTWHSKSSKLTAAVLASSTPLRHYSPRDDPNTCRDPAYRWTPHLLSCAVPRAIAAAAALCASREGEYCYSSSSSYTYNLIGSSFIKLFAECAVLPGVVLGIIEIDGATPAAINANASADPRVAAAALPLADTRWVLRNILAVPGSSSAALATNEMVATTAPSSPSFAVCTQPLDRLPFNMYEWVLHHTALGARAVIIYVYIPSFLRGASVDVNKDVSRRGATFDSPQGRMQALDARLDAARGNDLSEVELPAWTRPLTPLVEAGLVVLRKWGWRGKCYMT